MHKQLRCPVISMPSEENLPTAWRPHVVGGEILIPSDYGLGGDVASSPRGDSQSARSSPVTRGSILSSNSLMFAPVREDEDREVKLKDHRSNDARQSAKDLVRDMRRARKNDERQRRREARALRRDPSTFSASSSRRHFDHDFVSSNLPKLAGRIHLDPSERKVYIPKWSVFLKDRIFFLSPFFAPVDDIFSRSRRMFVFVSAFLTVLFWTCMAYALFLMTRPTGVIDFSNGVVLCTFAALASEPIVLLQRLLLVVTSPDIEIEGESIVSIRQREMHSTGVLASLMYLFALIIPLASVAGVAYISLFWMFTHPGFRFAVVVPGYVSTFVFAMVVDTVVWTPVYAIVSLRHRSDRISFDIEDELGGTATMVDRTTAPTILTPVIPAPATLTPVTRMESDDGTLATITSGDDVSDIASRVDSVSPLSSRGILTPDGDRHHAIQVHDISSSSD